MGCMWDAFMSDRVSGSSEWGLGEVISTMSRPQYIILVCLNFIFPEIS